MECVICKTGQTHSGRVTVTLQREGITLLIKDVPAEICDNCGEYYLSEAVTERVMQQAETAAGKNVELEILRFAA
ncbi:MAG TPA: type II toxin-antitoxin system MqsA family antitoxin [Gammaproteobacteria bacterium]|nr:type II toxin-antitoxin system MqsA family antitoxin [Gammaproteobacteria bacterium]